MCVTLFYDGSMEITDVQIDLIKQHDGLIGFASVVIEKSLFLSCIGIHKKINGLGYRLTYPSKGKFDVFHPINREASHIIEQAIFEKLKNVMKKVTLPCSSTTIQT